jgi:D-alanyl-D-alanine carboxypeptidase (penicillin-binding protein 5/6)
MMYIFMANFTRLSIVLASLTLGTIAQADNAPAVPVNTPHIATLANSANPSTSASPDAKVAAPKIAMPVVTVPPPPALDAKSYVIMDAATGKILAAYNPDTQLPPASLTKMMTSYVISMAIKDGKIHMTDLVPISEKAWRTGGSKMFVKVGTQVPVKDLMQGIIVDSGNDACVAMAEYVAGSEDAFANLMNQAGAALGMKNTHFVDSTGLPDPAHHSTAHDLAQLARGLVYSFPEDYQWYSQKWFTYNGIRQPNRNRLLWRDPSVDGIKTGHTDEAGFCLVSSAKRNGTRLIAVVMGAPTDAARADDSQKLLDYGFRFFETHVVYQANTKLNQIRVWHGQNKMIDIGVADPFLISVIPGQFSQVQYQFTNVPKDLQAPVQKGTAVGEVQAVLNGKVIETAPLVTLSDDPVGGFFSRLWDHVLHWFHRG